MPNALPAITRDALASDHSDAASVFTAARGIVNPSDWPLPLEHFDNIFQLADRDGTLRNVTLAEWEQREPLDEVCYVDGACYPHVIPTLARAGWAGAFYAGNRLVATASAPVWHPSPQTSWGAE